MQLKINRSSWKADTTVSISHVSSPAKRYQQGEEKGGGENSGDKNVKGNSHALGNATYLSLQFIHVNGRRKNKLKCE